MLLSNKVGQWTTVDPSAAFSGLQCKVYLFGCALTVLVKEKFGQATHWEYAGIVVADCPISSLTCSTADHQVEA